MKRRIMVDFKCEGCKETEGVKHKGNGLCVNCYYNKVYYDNKKKKLEAVENSEKVSQS